jgi:hypothetical protein
LTIIEEPLSAGINIPPRHCWFKLSAAATMTEAPDDGKGRTRW